MNSDDDKSWDSAINEAPNRGSFSSFTPPTNDAMRYVWRCPFCEHWLRYTIESKETAELAANSHMSRQHKQAGMVVVLPDEAAKAIAPASEQESSMPGRGGAQ